MKSGFSAAEISRLAGFKTSLMLNYLERTGTFSSEKKRDPHHGLRRRYTFRDLVVLRAINQLLIMGARPKRVAMAIATFKQIRNLPKTADGLLEFSKKQAFFIVSKDKVLFCETPEAVIDLTQGGQLQMAFMLSVSQTMPGVARAAKTYEEERLKKSGPNVKALNRIAVANGL